MQLSLPYDLSHHFKPFGLGGTVKPAKLEGDYMTIMYESISTLFKEQSQSICPLSGYQHMLHGRFFLAQIIHLPQAIAFTNI